MAVTKFYTDNALTRKRYADDLFRIILPNIEYPELVGTGSDAGVQMRKDLLTKGSGDKITFGIRRPLTGEGIVGDATWEGNEEKLSFKDFNMTIEELGHAVQAGGEMEAQRVPWNLLDEGKTALRDWWAQKLSDHMFAHICGDTTFKVAGKTFAQDPTNPDTGHLLVVNNKTEATVTSADGIDRTFLDAARQRAESPDPSLNQDIVRPFLVNGKPHYRVILHDYCFDQLRQNFNAGEFGDLARAAQKLGIPSVEIVYNGMMISKSRRIRKVADNIYRNVLFGPQAMTLAWGGAGKSTGTNLSFVVKQRDYDRTTMIAAGGIFGFKKVVFDGKDYGVLTLTGYGAALSA